MKCEFHAQYAFALQGAITWHCLPHPDLLIFKWEGEKANEHLKALLKG